MFYVFFYINFATGLFIYFIKIWIHITQTPMALSYELINAITQIMPDIELNDNNVFSIAFNSKPQPNVSLFATSA